MSMITNLSPVAIWEPPTAVARREPPRRMTWVAVAGEANVIALLERPLLVGETIQAGYQRIERELAAAFDALSLADARELHRRLCNPAADDVLATRFGRFVQERRQRLLCFLADAPRRAAFAGRRASK